ncbi:MAG: LamG-like jellyroll fold domain-containing protein [Planctomycetota bacterium]
MGTRVPSLFAAFLAVAVSWSVASGADEGIAAYWPMDEGEGDTIHDLSGNDNDGKVTGATWEKGRYGMGLRFDGADDYVEFGRDESLDVRKGLSIAAWIFGEEGGKQAQIVCRDYITRRLGYALWEGDWPDGNFRFWVGDGTDEHYVTAPRVRGEWVHLAGTFDGRFLRLYVNGALASAKEIGPGTEIEPLTADGIMGARSGAQMTNHFRGILDEVRIYNRGLARAEVMRLYRAGTEAVEEKARELAEALAKRPRVEPIDAAKIASFSDLALLASLMSTRRPITCEGVTFKFLRRSKEEGALAEVTDEERGRGYVLFQRGEPGRVYPDSAPRREEVVSGALGTFSTPGEYEPVHFALYPLRELRGVRVEVAGDLVAASGARIGRENVEVRRISAWVQRKEKGSKRYWIIPELLERMKPLDLPAHFTQGFWIVVKVPEEAPAGEYEGRIAVFAEGSPLAELALQVEVLPLRLMEPPGAYWFVAACDIDWGRTLDAEGVEAEVREIARQGCLPLLHTAYGGAGSPRMVVRDGHLAEFDCQRVRDLQALRRKLGLRGPLFINLDGSVNDELCKQMGLPKLPTDTWTPTSPEAQVLENEAYRRCFLEVLRKLDELVRETGGSDEGYTEWYYECFGEADSHAWRRPIAIWAAKACKEAGIKTTTALVFGSRTGFFEELAPYLDCAESWSSQTEEENRKDREAFAKHGIRFWDHHDLMATGQGFDLEGNVGAFRYLNGTLSYKNGSAGFRNFLWHYARGNAMNDLDCNSAREPKDGCFVYYADGFREIIPTLQWEGMREGIKDYKYLYTLTALAGRAKEAGKADERVAEIEREVAEMVARIPWAKEYARDPLSYDNSWSSGMRAKIADRIVEITKVLGE